MPGNDPLALVSACCYAATRSVQLKVPYHLNPATLTRKAMRILNRAMSGRAVAPEQLRAAETTIRVFSSQARENADDAGELGFQFQIAEKEEKSGVESKRDAAPLGIELYNQRKLREFRERGCQHKSQ